MKKTYRLLALVPAVLLLLSLGGCDMFRKLAGRPTAEELELMRIAKLKEEEAVRQARIDSLARVQKAKEDSIAVMDSLAQLKGTILNPSDLGGLFTTKLDSEYYIVVGSFKSRHNAEELFRRVGQEGYAPILVSFRNGFNSVAISPSNTLKDVFLALKQVKTEPFCPDDVWILVNR